MACDHSPASIKSRLALLADDASNLRRTDGDPAVPVDARRAAVLRIALRRARRRDRRGRHGQGAPPFVERHHESRSAAGHGSLLDARHLGDLRGAVPVRIPVHRVEGDSEYRRRDAGHRRRRQDVDGAREEGNSLRRRSRVQRQAARTRRRRLCLFDQALDRSEPAGRRRSRADRPHRRRAADRRCCAQAGRQVRLRRPHRGAASAGPVHGGRAARAARLHAARAARGADHDGRRARSDRSRRCPT